MKYTDPPFEIGEVMDGTDPNDSTNLINKAWLGQVFFHPANRLTGSNVRAAKDRYSGLGITAVILRNTSGISLLPKQIVRLGNAGYDSTHECFGWEEVDGYAVNWTVRPMIVDPWLASAGVSDNDLFWGIIRGRVMLQTPVAGSAFSGDIAAGGALVANTVNQTTGNSTVGRVSNVTLPGQTGATIAFQVATNLIGYAVSAKTTGNTATDILVEACIKY